MKLKTLLENVFMPKACMIMENENYMRPQKSYKNVRLRFT
jgi:hypothetical protein